MKTFELTQEQINQLAEKKHAKELLQKFIPEAFETKLEVGKYYIHKIHNDLINIAEINEKDEIKFYGFDYDKTENTSEFIDERNSPSFYGYGKEFKNWRLATEEEVSEALINEFKKRLGKNKKVKTLKDKWEEPIIIEVNFEEFRYFHKENELWTSCKKTGIGYKVFDNGKWTKIIEETNTFDKDYLDNKITEIHSLLGDIKQYVNQLQNEN